MNLIIKVTENFAVWEWLKNLSLFTLESLHLYMIVLCEKQIEM